MSFFKGLETEWKLFVLLFVISVPIIVGSFLLLLYSIIVEPNEPEMSPSQQPLLQEPEDIQVETKLDTDLFENWQIYQNEEFGFEMKYPENFNITEVGKVEGEDLSVARREFALVIGDGDTLAQISVRDYNNTINWCTSEFFEKGDLIKLAGELRQRCLTPDFGGEEPVNYAVLLGSHSDLFFDFTCNKTESEECDQILFTFRFVDKETIVPVDKESCEAQDGEWKPVGAARQFQCIFTYSDGGKPCQSSDECESSCVVYVDTQETGFCKGDSDYFGCYTVIENFKEEQGILCRD